MVLGHDLISGYISRFGITLILGPASRSGPTRISGVPENSQNPPTNPGFPGYHYASDYALDSTSLIGSDSMYFDYVCLIGFADGLLSEPISLLLVFGLSAYLLLVLGYIYINSPGAWVHTQLLWCLATPTTSPVLAYLHVCLWCLGAPRLLDPCTNFYHP